MNKITRHQERIWALQLLYSLDLLGELEQDEARKKIRELKIEVGLLEERYYFEDLIEGVTENIKELDKKINQQAIDWKIERMAFVDRNILRIALYEIAHDIPVGVAINEAVELAKEYSDVKSAGFINGILARIE